jgi:hypothetical protein
MAPSRYESKVKEIEQDYNSKQAKARELVEKLFDPSHMSYSKFTAAIEKSNQLFANQLKITQKMMELESRNSFLPFKSKVKTDALPPRLRYTHLEYEVP